MTKPEARFISAM